MVINFSLELKFVGMFPVTMTSPKRRSLVKMASSEDQQLNIIAQEVTNVTQLLCCFMLLSLKSVFTVAVRTACTMALSMFSSVQLFL